MDYEGYQEAGNNALFNQDVNTSFDMDTEADTSFASEVSSLYLPTPQKLAKQTFPKVFMPKKLFHGFILPR